MRSAASRSGLVLERSPVEVVRPPERFEDFYVKEYSAVVGLAYALSGSRSGAEDPLGPRARDGRRARSS